MKIFALISFIYLNAILGKLPRSEGLDINSDYDSTIIISLRVGNDLRDSCKLLIGLSGQNLVFKVMDTQMEYLYDASGCGACELPNVDKKEDLVQKTRLDNSGKYPQFIITPSVHGSTYGAEYLFIIWHEVNNWHILKTSFHRFVIKDSNGKGHREIIDYTKTSAGISYTFEKGLLRRAK
ncbi:MAG TPA: hypothetical protein VG890_15525 [Puia sp.]|nr:hypothetical protein [Puia sp.]